MNGSLILFILIMLFWCFINDVTLSRHTFVSNISGVYMRIFISYSINDYYILHNHHYDTEWAFYCYHLVPKDHLEGFEALQL